MAMSSSKRARIYGKYATNDQKEAIIDHLEKHLSLARNQFTSVDGKNSLAAQWNNVALKLNSLGGANKNGVQWKKFWDDLKLRVKHKYCEMKKRLNKSGINGLDPIPELTDLEQRIINIVSVDAVDGDSETQEFGFNNDIPQPCRQDISILDDLETDIFERNKSPIQTGLSGLSTTKKVNKKVNKPNLVRENKEDKFYAEVIQLKKKKIEIEQEKVKLMREDIALKKEIVMLLKKLQPIPINSENLTVEYLESDLESVLASD